MRLEDLSQKYQDQARTQLGMEPLPGQLQEPAHAPASRPQAEKELQRLCEQELSRRGIVYLHLSPMAREKVGWPDLVFCANGIPRAVELKTATGRLSPDQERILSRMQANGWQTYVVRSFDVFKSLLEVQHARLSLLPS